MQIPLCPPGTPPHHHHHAHTHTSHTHTLRTQYRTIPNSPPRRQTGAACSPPPASAHLGAWAAARAARCVLPDSAPCVPSWSCQWAPKQSDDSDVLRLGGSTCAGRRAARTCSCSGCQHPLPPCTGFRLPHRRASQLIPAARGKTSQACADGSAPAAAVLPARVAPAPTGSWSSSPARGGTRLQRSLTAPRVSDGDRTRLTVSHVCSWLT